MIESMAASLLAHLRAKPLTESMLVPSSTETAIKKLVGTPEDMLRIAEWLNASISRREKMLAALLPPKPALTNAEIAKRLSTQGVTNGDRGQWQRILDGNIFDQPMTATEILRRREELEHVESMRSIFPKGSPAGLPLAEAMLA